nr:iron uptake transporter deferrochelatase/peroxidase subunit [Alicyclobacillus contaminans]
MSRREMLKLTATAGIGAALGIGGMKAIVYGAEKLTGDSSKRHTLIPFHGMYQAGIITPQQDHVVFATYDLTTSSLLDLRDLLKTWTQYAQAMCSGNPVGQMSSNAYLPPVDTGEAEGLEPSRLTLTFGFGPTLFHNDSGDRFGLAARKPTVLQQIPPMQRDQLDPNWCGGDLCVQACADNPQVAFHAIRNLTRAAAGVAALRWMQDGFLKAPTDASGQPQTPRNLFGFKDGTANRDILTDTAMKQYLWASAADGPAWMANGTYLAVRRIQMLIQNWDRSSLKDQESTFGRHKVSGAPFGASNEFDKINPAALPADSHVRLAHGDGTNKMLRRSYSYLSGVDPKTGLADVGLLFLAFQRNPQKQFVPVLQRLQESDALNEYIVHVGSAVFACPPGVQPGGYVGQTLLESM